MSLTEYHSSTTEESKVQEQTVQDRVVKCYLSIYVWICVALNSDFIAKAMMTLANLGKSGVQISLFLIG